MKRLGFAFLLGVVLGLVCRWWRREDPFVVRYGWQVPR